MEYVLKMDAGLYGYFTTEWYGLWHDTKERDDLPQNAKNAILKMYATMLEQAWKQELEFYSNIKEFDEFYTEEHVEEIKKCLTRQLEEIKN